MRERYDCPIATCTWHYTPPTAPEPESALAEFYFSSTNDTRDRTTKLALNEHFASHDQDQWVAEVIALRASCDIANANAKRAEVQINHAKWFISMLRKTAKGSPDGPLRRGLAKQLSELLRDA
jgi:hypothetical protein